MTFQCEVLGNFWILGTTHNFALPFQKAENSYTHSLELISHGKDYVNPSIITCRRKDIWSHGVSVTVLNKFLRQLLLPPLLVTKKMSPFSLAFIFSGQDKTKEKRRQIKTRMTTKIRQLARVNYMKLMLQYDPKSRLT